MQISLGEIARTIDGALVGSPDKRITGVALIDDATSEQITFTDIPSTLQLLDEVGVFAAGAVIVPLDYRGSRTNVIKVSNPQLACARVISLFHPALRPAPSVHPNADVHRSAILGRGVHVGPWVTIGERTVVGDRVVILAGACVGSDVVINADSTLGCRVVVATRTRIGERVTIHPGAVIGSDGFGYLLDERANLHRIPHVGCVVIEDDVEIGAGVAIERANLGQTLIQQGAKIGNLVQIGHNVDIGRNTRIIAQAGIGGNTVIGQHVTIGGQAGIEQNLTIGDHAVIGPQAGIIRDVLAGERAFGTPGMPLGAWLRSGVLIPHLWRIHRQIGRLVKRVDALWERLGG